MPGTTPNRHYPYPLDTEGIDVAGDVQRLAEALDADMALAVSAGNNEVWISDTPPDDARVELWYAPNAILP